MAKLTTERKIRLSKLDTEFDEASSPISINTIHVILCLPKKGICTPQKVPQHLC